MSTPVSEQHAAAHRAREVPGPLRVTDGVWAVPVPLHGSPLRSITVFLVETSEGLVLIDAGYAHRSCWESFTASLGECNEQLQERYGIYPNGLILISSVLDLSSIEFDKQRNDRAHALYLPTYAAVAHYHGKHGRRSLRSVLDEAQAYADRDYPWVLSRGGRLGKAERAEAVATVARLSGLSEDYIDRADLRIEHWRYFTELLRDQRLSVGRIDSRFTGPAASAIAENMDADPSMDAITGPYAAAWNHYVRDELGYDNDLHYEQISRLVHPCSFKDFEGRPVDVSPHLERAMRQNPHLRVHIAYGYYDGATPHYAAEDVVAHLQLPPELHANIEHAYYEAGHMMYVHEPSRVKQSRDLADFVMRSSGLPT